MFPSQRTENYFNKFSSQTGWKILETVSHNYKKKNDSIYWFSNVGLRPIIQIHMHTKLKTYPLCQILSNQIKWTRFAYAMDYDVWWPDGRGQHGLVNDSRRHRMDTHIHKHDLSCNVILFSKWRIGQCLKLSRVRRI